ncbi:hypothetical protein [Flavobacterium sp.]|uniref:hypothetical protein n=1 Tax=Flavobacterium sp. TaxID=239 RepID=UPI00286E7BAF|nr:hypothetical protein [Flavobacterium sp.]
MNQLSKDQIKDRLLKRAAKHWGYSDVELENVFDPIVNLLFDVCAKELEKISNEIFSSRRRITERLIDILTPTASTKATAARGILKAYPVENESVLHNYHQFYFQKKEINPYNPTESVIKSYYFGPTKPIKLNRNKINYVVLPNGVQQVIKDQFKELTSSKNYKNPTPHGTIWIGLQHEGDGVIRDLMFYFHLKNLEHKNIFFNFLPRAKWFLNDTELTISKGYNSDAKTEAEETALMQQDFYHIDKAQDHINDYYKDNFLTIKDIINISDDDYKVPADFENFIPIEDLKKIKEDKLLWLKIVFPNVVGPHILSEIFCANNCFPVINKKLNETQGSIKDILNIYPLNLNQEYFLELFSVLNDKNKEYDIVNIDESNDEDYAYLRFGGIARFDERNATEEINYLIDLIRDEASAFSRLGNDFTDNNLKEINQIISRFKNKISQIGIQNSNNPYLILNSNSKNEKGTLFVKYWTTNGESANKINTFSKFALHKGSDFDKDSIQLLSTTKGGKNELTNSEKIYAYRENLISNQRVVTRQDIIILCKNHYGDSIESIEVKNGIQTSLDSNIGYVPTIDIYLVKNKSSLFNEDEWEFLREDVKLLIENRAINIVPFRLIYKE